MAEPGASELQPLRPGKAMTIGAVCQALSREFPDISISKLRYLEHQKLLEPRRTPGGYRLYGPADVDRLRAILRMQRDEFLPLRVIRQELAAGRAEGAGAGDEKAADARPRRMPTVGSPGHARYSLDEVLDDTRADAGLIKELQEFGVVRPQIEDGEPFFDDTDREIVRAAAELARYGVGGRNLRVFRTSADREAALLQQILAPSLRSKNQQRRTEAVEALENLATVTSHLKHLLLVRDLRNLLR